MNTKESKEAVDFDRLTACIGFEWDGGNSEKYWAKHRVTRSESEQVFFNCWQRASKKSSEQGGADPLGLRGAGETESFAVSRVSSDPSFEKTGAVMRRMQGIALDGEWQECGRRLGLIGPGRAAGRNWAGFIRECE